MPPHKKNLIISADDYGCCNFIDRGILRGIDRGVVTCVSTFINFRPRETGEPGGKYEGSHKALIKLINKHPRIPVGLHLTINAGNSIFGESKLPDLMRSKKIKGKHYFKDINKFKPKLYLDNKVVRTQIKNEVEAQLFEYKNNFGKPNHISCHYGILFHFKSLLKEVLKIDEAKKYPCRNPILPFQTPDIIKDSAIDMMSDYYKAKSKMRIEGIGKGLKWAILYRNLIKLSVDASVKDRLKLLQKAGIRFPDYTIDYLYKRRGDFKSLEVPIRNMTREIPKILDSSTRKPKSAVYEIIAHLGQGIKPAKGPIGVNMHYFDSRKVELKRLEDNRKLLRGPEIKLVDFSILK